MKHIDIDKEYKESLEVASSHYENFPVVSFLVPKKLRKHVAVIYKYARMADDLADEGDLSPQERIKALDCLEADLKDALAGEYKNGFFRALVGTIHEKKLTPSYFFDLLTAFRQDVRVKRYNTFEEVMDYCRFSANPVGRIILELFEVRSEKLALLSDKICSALQLANFYQDASIDLKKGRIYIPLEEMKKFNVTENDFELKKINTNFKELIRLQVDRTRELFLEGKPLTAFLPRPLNLEIKWTVLGGLEILDKIKDNGYDVINKRPKLGKLEYFNLFIKSIFEP
ncbi:MAG: squalene synthase HpnC [Ignavibacteria bacterium]|nr:squalene synthase HpnC [Ignavibacteria bacterium]MCU7501657.1 squalene synthase HpnC [Ignavibacteria bacterium]MCU7517754.1 squalene synthase HpnC [Ignavibacteria bacterium]